MTNDRIPIGRFSLMTHLTCKALRLYDRKGLLVPEAKDQFTGYRYYTFPQIEKGIKIKTLCWLGFGLDEIGTLLDAEEEGKKDIISDMMRNRALEVRSDILRLEKIEQVLLKPDSAMELLGMNVSEPQIKDIPELRVLSRREIGTYEDTISKHAGELFGFVGSQAFQHSNAKITGPVMFICHDKEYKEIGADIETALPFAGRVNVDDPAIKERTMPAVQVVSAIYKGPYDGVEMGYSRLFEYMTEHGLEIAGESRSLYINDPKEVPEEELLTEVQIPVKKTK
ncbi:MAG: DNA-binding transcriptional regulator CueR [Methanomethylovorans sp. PtaU1.Bin073]|jgi:effector-binding domain-containing protein|nr:MAG: DNA-binding transcriptional regulator CueR [Methanomethylovorans sp. PtaU1.Bin073]